MDEFSRRAECWKELSGSARARLEIAKRLPNVHPGEVLLEEFLKPMGISQNRLAHEISMPPQRVNEIVLGKRPITSDMALRLARYLGTSEKFWLGIQIDFDLEEAKRPEGAQA